MPAARKQLAIAKDPTPTANLLVQMGSSFKGGQVTRCMEEMEKEVLGSDDKVLIKL